MDINKPAINHIEKLKKSVNGFPYNAKYPEWQYAFAYYNNKHEQNEWLAMSCRPCFAKVLHFILTEKE
jgi:hypothetical protein